jgi:rhomboid family GlyGly-CTERM serine protease
LKAVGHPPTRQRHRVPLVTVFVIIVAVLTAQSSGLSELLIYDRQAVADGALWRIVTGSMVHFSTSHLWYDSGALMVVGALAEWRDPRRFAILSASAMLTVGSAIHVFAPQFDRFAGLSGVVYAATAFFAIELFRSAHQRRWLGAAVIAILCAKTSYEWLTGGTLFASYDGDVAAAPIAHLAGILVGVAIASWHAGPSSHLKRSSQTEDQISRSLAS